VRVGEALEEREGARPQRSAAARCGRRAVMGAMCSASASASRGSPPDRRRGAFRGRHGRGGAVTAVAVVEGVLRGRGITVSLPCAQSISHRGIRKKVA
jgi:hypothetical protein